MRYHLAKGLRWKGVRYKMLVHRDHRMNYFEDETMLGEILEVLRRPWYRRMVRWPWFAWEIEADDREILYYFWASNETVGEEIRKKILGKHPNMEITRVKGTEIELSKCEEFACSSMKLDREYTVPIKTFFNELVDSQAAIVNAVSDLSEGQKCLIQILVQPALDYQDRFDKSIEIVKKWNEEDEFKKRELFETAIYGKQTKLLADCSIRILAGGKSSEIARKTLAEVSRSFGQFTSEALNGFKPVERWMHIKPLLIHDVRHRLYPIVRRKNRRVILNIEELSGVVRLPSEKVHLSKLTRLRMKQLEAPANVQDMSNKVRTEGQGARYVHIGTNTFRMKVMQIYLDLLHLVNHMEVLGGTGVGKTNFLVSLFLKVCELRRLGMRCGFFLIDPLGGLAQELGSNIPEDMLHLVNYVQPDPLADRHFPFNLYDVDFPASKDTIAKNVYDSIARIWPEGVGPRVENNFTFGAIALQYFREANIINLDKLLRNPAYMMVVAQHLKRQPDFEQKDVIIEYLVKLARLGASNKPSDVRMKADYTDSTLNKLSNFTLSPLFHSALGAATSGFRWLESMEQGYLNILDLSKLKSDQQKKIYGSLAFTMNYQAAISRNSVDDLDLYFIAADEYAMFIEANEKVVKEMADTTRQKRTPLVLASQGIITQLEKSVADAVGRNFGTHIAFRVNHPEDAGFLEKLFNDPNLTASDFQNTPENYAYARISQGRNTSLPFSLLTNPPQHSPADASKIERLVNMTIDRAFVREKAAQEGIQKKYDPKVQDSPVEEGDISADLAEGIYRAIQDASAPDNPEKGQQPGASEDDEDIIFTDRADGEEGNEGEDDGGSDAYSDVLFFEGDDGAAAATDAIPVARAEAAPSIELGPSTNHELIQQPESEPGRSHDDVNCPPDLEENQQHKSNSFDKEEQSSTKNGTKAVEDDDEFVVNFKAFGSADAKPAETQTKRKGKGKNGWTFGDESGSSE